MYVRAKTTYPTAFALSLDELVRSVRDSSWGICEGYHGLWDMHEDGTIDAKEAIGCYRHMRSGQIAALNWMIAFAGQDDPRVSRAKTIISIIDDYLIDLGDPLTAPHAEAA